MPAAGGQRRCAPAVRWISSRRRRRCAAASGRFRPREPTTPIGAWRLPARRTRSSSSTLSTRAPGASWRTSRTPTRRIGATRSRDRLTCCRRSAGTLTHEGSDGRHYKLDERVATLLVRPRGWHLPEKHIRSARGPISGALMDFGLYAFHCAARAPGAGLGPVPLPAQARAPPRGATLERRARVHRAAPRRCPTARSVRRS